MVHSQTQIGELGLGCVIGQARFQPLGGAVEPLAQGPALVGITQFAEQSPDFFRSPPGLCDQLQGGGESDPARLRVLQDAALKHAALRWPIRVDATGAIRAQSRARLGKAGDRLLPARKRDGQPEPFQFPGIIIRLQFDEVEKCPVAAEPARAAEIFAWFHEPSIRCPGARWQGGFRKHLLADHLPVTQLIRRRRGGLPGRVAGARWTQGGTGLPG